MNCLADAVHLPWRTCRCQGPNTNFAFLSLTLLTHQPTGARRLLPRFFVGEAASDVCGCECSCTVSQLPHLLDRPQSRSVPRRLRLSLHPGSFLFHSSPSIFSPDLQETYPSKEVTHLTFGQPRTGNQVSLFLSAYSSDSDTLSWSFAGFRWFFQRLHHHKRRPFQRIHR